MRLCLFILAALLGALPEVAYARREGRSGFNFGTTLTVSSDTTSEDGEQSTTERQTQVYGVNPHVGYAFSGLFNFGLRLTSEQITLTERETPKGDGGTATSESTFALNGGALYGRLLFARVMFLDAAIGQYHGSLSETEGTVTGADGEFVGSKETRKVSGIGLGYEFGGGLEIPVALGFYFEGAYAYRNVTLGGLGAGTSSPALGARKSEFRFGINHYLQ